MASKREREQRERRRTSAKEWAKKQGRNMESTAVKIPEGMEYYKLEVGTHLVDFIPYIAGKGNPMADEGFEHFEREYSAHRIPGPDGRTRLYCCRWECFKKKCPICEYANSSGTNQDTAKALRPTVRHLWLVNDKPGDRKNKLKVFDTNHYNRGIGFGEMMAEAINAVPKYANFANLEGGMTLQLTVKEMTAPGMKWNGVSRIDFLPREYDYPEDMLESAPCLDSMLVEYGYDELKRVLNQDEEEEPKKPASTKASVDEEEDDEDVEEEDELDEEESEEDDELEEEETANGKKEPTAQDKGFKVGQTVLYKGDECRILKISKDGTSLTLEDEDGDELKAISPSAVKKLEPAESSDDEEEEEDDLPTRKKPGRKPAPKVEEDELDEEEDDLDDEDDDSFEEEDEPPARKPVRKGKK